jgi:signal transduction histidine kinase
MRTRIVVEFVIFMAAYVALDHISFIYPFKSLSITPWSPATGLLLALLLLRGPSRIPAAFAAPLLAEYLLRDLHGTWSPSTISATVNALAYGSAAHFLTRSERFDLQLPRLKDVVVLTAVSAGASLAVATISVGAFTGAGLLETERFTAATTRYWIGDMIGIAVVTPFLLLAHTFRAHQLSARALAEAIAQGLAIIAAVWLVFGVRAADEFRLFYLLFLPLIWAAARFGVTGAVLANLGGQVALLTAIQILRHESTTVTAFQVLMLALAIGTLMLGAAVSEGRRTAAVLQAKLVELAQISRLSVAGELAAALAHELNQPLLAAIAFARAGQRFLDSHPEEREKARSAIDRAVGEAQRAGDIINSLRRFIGQDLLVRQPVAPSVLIADVLALAAPEARQRGIVVSSSTERGLGPITVDRIQVQQVLINLVRNALDAMSQARSREAVVELYAFRDGPSVIFEVADRGPGIPDEVAERLFQPFTSSKAQGMGLGLSICRTLVEAHGGRLWLERTGSDGTTFRFSLPMDKTET